MTIVSERRIIMKRDRYLILSLLILTVLLLPFSAFADYKATKHYSLGLTDTYEMENNGEFQISVLIDGKWQEAGKLTFDRYFRKKNVDLGGLAAGAKEIKIKLIQKGGGAAHIDAALLGVAPPILVDGLENGLKKLSKADFDVADAFGKEIIITFPENISDRRFSLTARVEGTVISKTPFQFPIDNLYKEIDTASRFYTYEINSRNGFSPIFKEFSPTGSGHPSGFTYGWVRNDDRNLYVKIDFTPDDTMDGDKDYAKVYVKTGKGLKEFKVSVPEEKWGKPHFTYTDKVTYQHKVYDFTIPFTELGIGDVKDGENLLLAFAAYGTATPGNRTQDIAYDPSNGHYLIVYLGNYNYKLFGQLLDCDGTPLGEAQVIEEVDPLGSYSLAEAKIAYDSVNHRFLVVWSHHYDIYGKFVGADGTPSETTITISDDSSSQTEPVAAYDNNNQQYLVVWIDNRNGTADIYGQRLNAAGAVIGSNFAICDEAGHQLRPSVAFDGTVTYSHFLVAWDDNQTGPSNHRIYGRIVNGDGTLFGSDSFSIAASGDNMRPQVSDDSTNHRFLVVWPDYASEDIAGQLVNASDGSLYSGKIQITDDGELYGQNIPAVAYDSGSFLAVWEDTRNDPGLGIYPGIYGRYISASGTPDAGGDFPVVYGSSSSVQYNNPHIAYNSDAGNFLASYTSYQLGSGENDIGITRVGPACGGGISIDDILSFFDDSVESDDLTGTGPGKSADKRLTAFRNMLVKAKSMIDSDSIAEACQQLLDAYYLADGNKRPADLVQGDAAADLAGRLQELMTSLGCD